MLFHQICECCGGSYGDFSAGNVVCYAIGSSHSALLAKLKSASQDLAQEHMGSKSHHHPASQWSRGGAIGAPPCTGSIIAATFAVGDQAIAPGFALILAIAGGMAATLGGAGRTARALRGATVARASGNAENWWHACEALGGGLLPLTGGVFAYASF